MSLKSHISDSLRLQKAPTPLPRMILCALSVTLPLVSGVLFKEERSSIYGALLGFILILNDHFGPLKQRIVHLLTAFMFLAIAFMVGLLISDTPWLLLPLLFIMAFMLGKTKGLGLELERLVLFSTFQLLNAALTPQLKGHAFKLFIYAGLSLANYLICLTIVYIGMKHAPNFQRRKREELKEAFSRKESHRYAFTLAAVSVCGLLLSHLFRVERGQWMVGTILIVMMPSKTQSFQRSFQRIVGTFAGVILSSILLYFVKDSVYIIPFATLAAFLAPLGLIKNYWLGNTFIAALIMLFLQFGTPAANANLGMLRIMDISMGCVIGAIGTVIAFPDSLSRFFRK